jgi:O-antigen/teichoic acid export membrane protein
LGFLIILPITYKVWNRHSKSDLSDRKASLTIVEILKVSAPMSLSSSIGFLMGWADTILIGILRTEAELGIYNVAFRIAMITSIILFAVNSIAAPKFAELYGCKNYIELRRTLRTVRQIIFCCSVPLFLILFYKASWILALFGPDFENGKTTLLLLLVGQFVSVVAGPMSNILEMSGREKCVQNVMVSALFANLIFSVILIPKYGIVGAAISNMICVAGRNVIWFHYVESHMNVLTVNMPTV